MPLMERIKCRSFLEMTLEEQTELIRSIQLTRSKSLKEASKKKVRKTANKKTTTTKKKSKSTKPRVKKLASDHVNDLDQAQLLELAKKYGIEI